MKGNGWLWTRLVFTHQGVTICPDCPYPWCRFTLFGAIANKSERRKAMGLAGNILDFCLLSEIVKTSKNVYTISKGAYNVGTSLYSMCQQEKSYTEPQAKSEKLS